MATNQQQNNEQPLPQVDPKQVENAVRAMTGQAAQAGAPALNMFAELQQRRAARMANIAAALAQHVGDKHPNVLAIRNAAENLVQLKTWITNQTTRLKNWPKPKPNEWLVFGNVTDSTGNPVSGLTVRVFDKDRKLDDLLGEASTDENGDSWVIYHERDFKEMGENLPDLYVMVSDASGKLLYSSRDKVRFEANKSEYFAIRVDIKTKEKKSGAQTAKKKPRKT